MIDKVDLLCKMIVDRKWDVRFLILGGFPQLKRYGEWDVVLPYKVFFGGDTLDNGTTPSTRDDNDPYSWRAPPSITEMLLNDLMHYQSMYENNPWKIYKITQALKGLDNWKRANGKDYPDEHDVAPSPREKRTSHGVQRP